MALTRQNVQMRLSENAERLDKLSSDFLHLAEKTTLEGLNALQAIRKSADEGRMSYLAASEAAAGMATAMQDTLEAIEEGQSSFDLHTHQNEYDAMIESLLALRGQARRTGQALGRHISRLAQQKEDGEADEVGATG